MCRAAFHGCNEIVEMLIESGFDVNAVDNVRTILLIILPMACLMWVLYVKMPVGNFEEASDD